MTDPQLITATDVDTLRVLAERYTTHPEVTAHLYAAADYLAVLQRGQHQQQDEPGEAGGTESRQVPPIVGEACPMQWAVSVQSVAAGIDLKEETCGRPASEPVEYQGALYVVCPECKDELVRMGGRELR